MHRFASTSSSWTSAFCASLAAAAASSAACRSACRLRRSSTETGARVVLPRPGSSGSGRRSKRASFSASSIPRGNRMSLGGSTRSRGPSSEPWAIGSVTPSPCTSASHSAHPRGAGGGCEEEELDAIGAERRAGWHAGRGQRRARARSVWKREAAVEHER
eukprot:scaffold191037_cov31-Tisochrysis_lutea.AAC.3